MVACSPFQLRLSTQKMANTSPAIASSHSTTATMRSVVAFDFASGVGFQVGSLARLSGVDSTRTTFFATFILLGRVLGRV